MSPEMKVNNLNVDLLQDQAVVALFKQGLAESGKVPFTAVNVQVPLSFVNGSGDRHLRERAIEAAKNALEEALQVLNAYAA